jgi:hypothetical protein
VQNSNSTITAFLSSYIKIATRYELMKRLVKAHNLKAVLDVSIGCSIMLMENLWTERGLVNSAFGTMEDLLGRQMPPALTRSHRMPFSFISIVMMALIPTVDGNKIITIFRSKPEFSRHNISRSRTQFPITTYAILSIRPRASPFGALC